MSPPVTPRPFFESLVVVAFISGVFMTAGFYAESIWMIVCGVAFLAIFFAIAILGVIDLRREMLEQRRYERSKKGFSWRS